MRSKPLILLCAFSPVLYAGGYKIPENSINSTALSAAYVANAHGADAAYHNPAAMVFNEDRSMLEADLTYIHLHPIDFSGTVSAVPVNESSEEQNFLIPSFHYTSPAVGNARYGLSVVVPAGLTKRWKGTVPRASAEKFSLKAVEINPSAAYKFSDQFSAALGLRAIYSEGIVRSTSATASRNLTGDSWDYGFNLALLYKVNDRLDLAATYRSNVDLSVEGDAVLTGAVAVPPIPYSGPASVSVPIPAALALAAAFDVTPSTTVEVVYERTFWDEYDSLDFNYAVSIGAPYNAFDDPIPKDWNNTNTLRIGLTHDYGNQWTVMAGYAYDETPVPERTLGFELPDSDAHIFSVGARKQVSNDLSFGVGFLYDHKTSHSVSATTNQSNIGGKFENAAAYLLTMGFEYKL
ncbi:MAG: outer membrane protein transport protein [Chromatiales bacterium]